MTSTAPAPGPASQVDGLSRLLQPRSIAIVGASADERTINGQVLANLQRRGFKGDLYPVNPKYQAVGGLECFEAIDRIPGTPDLAIVLLGAAHAVQAVAQCGRHHIPFACVIGAGFAELGGEGERLQAELVAVARQHGIRLVGPNCIGLMNVPDDVFAGFGPIFGMADLKAGTLSLATQSGGFGFGVVNMADEMGIGFRYAVSTGNEADLTSLDFFDAFIDDPGTRVLAGYFEGIRDAHRLPDVARRALAARKPVIVWKVGDTPEGERAAASHTGNLGGAAALYRAAFDQFGWIAIDDVHELVDCARAFASGKLPVDPNVGIVTVSGGAGVLLADRCAVQGLRVPALAQATRDRLGAVLPAYASTQNPVDITATVLNDPSLLRKALEIILEDGGVGSLIVVASSVEGPMAESIASELVALDAVTRKPIYVSWNARETRVGGAYRMLHAANVPLYRTPSRCCYALAAAHRFSQALVRHSRDAAAGSAGPVAAGRGSLPPVGNEYEAKQFLAAHGLATTAEALARTEQEAVAAARRIGYPVALKIQSPDIAHKTEAGGVRLHLSDAAAVAAAFHEVLDSARAYAPAARLSGVLVQEMVDGGVETILGVVNDERFGPAVMFGLGGIHAELLQDVVFRFAPISIEAAREMVASIRGHAVLTGARGCPVTDVEALARAIVCVSGLIESVGDDVAEIDINPLVVLPHGRGVRVVDALVVPKRPTSGPSGPAPE
ncbi:acetate--CoA ligase family protein [Ramlibacter sp. AW1]|uniref:Acetate--CoA ligase family protein n=1 Tax=Ramlibacter aurantiacus TaxID=2801330 RepID=A0A937D4W5_9BURK|nr:acetate--CoA ligase family protein [Ramlibacter aurantiacus]MBL0419303.1 acetate--CoA ligase family protein [Ramlibacter aurantiacus]